MGVDPVAPEIAQISTEVKQFALSQGVELFGVASAACYAERFPYKPDPRKLVQDARSIIVIGLPFEPATMSTVLRPELARVSGGSSECSDGAGESVFSASAYARRWFLQEEKLVLYRELDLYGYRIAKFLRRKGWTALHVSPNKKDLHFLRAPFYHMPAVYLAGLGTLGLNCCILTPEFGPRFIATSIITDCELVPGEPMEEELCINCGLCVKACPSGAIDGEGWKNGFACAAYGCCGTCIAICPVGRVKVSGV